MTDEITISKAEYDSKTRKSTYLTILCDALVRDWIDAESRCYGGISDNVKGLLKALDPDRYAEAEKKVADVRARQSSNKAAEWLRGAMPDIFPRRSTDNPGVPVQEIKIRDNPGSDPQITCETKE